MLKLITLLLIQILVIFNFAWAGEVVFYSLKTENSQVTTLAPQVQISADWFKDVYQKYEKYSNGHPAKFPSAGTREKRFEDYWLARLEKEGIFEYNPEKIKIKYKLIIDALIKKFGDLKGKKILEIGCGYGDFLKFLRDEYGAIVSGYELIPFPVEATKDWDLDIHIGDAKNMVEFKNETFDAVISNGVFEGIPFSQAEADAIINELNRVLKKKGFHFHSAFSGLYRYLFEEHSDLSVVEYYVNKLSSSKNLNELVIAAKKQELNILYQEDLLHRLNPYLRQAMNVLERYKQEGMITRYYLSGGFLRGELEATRDIDIAVVFRRLHPAIIEQLQKKLDFVSQQAGFKFHLTPEAFGYEYEIKDGQIKYTGIKRGEEILSRLVHPEEKSLIRLDNIGAQVLSEGFFWGLFRKCREFDFKMNNLKLMDADSEFHKILSEEYKTAIMQAIEKVNRIMERIITKFSLSADKFNKELIQIELNLDYKDYHSKKTITLRFNEITKDFVFRVLMDAIYNFPPEHIEDLKTYFNRSPLAYRELSENLLPELFRRKMAQGQYALRIWINGCSTGEEVKSYLMAIEQMFLKYPDEFGQIEQWQIEMVATDLSTEALTEAQTSTSALNLKKPNQNPCLNEKEEFSFLNSNTIKCQMYTFGGKIIECVEKGSLKINYQLLDLDNAVWVAEFAKDNAKFGFDIISYNMVDYAIENNGENIRKTIARLLRTDGILMTDTHFVKAAAGKEIEYEIRRLPGEYPILFSSYKTYFFKNYFLENWDIAEKEKIEKATEDVLMAKLKPLKSSKALVLHNEVKIEIGRRGDFEFAILGSNLLLRDRITKNKLLITFIPTMVPVVKGKKPTTKFLVESSIFIGGKMYEVKIDGIVDVDTDEKFNGERNKKGELVIQLNRITANPELDKFLGRVTERQIEPKISPLSILPEEIRVLEQAI